MSDQLFYALIAVGILLAVIAVLALRKDGRHSGRSSTGYGGSSGSGGDGARFNDRGDEF